MTASLMQERKTWYQNGQLWTREFLLNGKREGEMTFWYEDGQLCCRKFYQNGKQNGEIISWYANGTPCERSFYRNGKKDGEIKRWYFNGYLDVHRFYHDGLAVKFHFRTKQTFLLIMKNYRRNVIRSADTTIISDLLKIIS